MENSFEHNSKECAGDENTGMTEKFRMSDFQKPGLKIYFPIINGIDRISE